MTPEERTRRRHRMERTVAEKPDVRRMQTEIRIVIYLCIVIPLVYGAYLGCRQAMQQSQEDVQNSPYSGSLNDDNPLPRRYIFK